MTHYSHAGLLVISLRKEAGSGSSKLQGKNSWFYKSNQPHLEKVVGHHHDLLSC